MASISLYAVNVKNGKSIETFVELTKANWSLPKNKKWRMGIDQSSGCTGLYFVDTEESFHLMADVFRGSDDKFRYYEQLRLFIARLIEGCEIVSIAMEDLPPYKHRNMGKVLLELRGVVQSWYSSIEELSKVPEDRKVKILPQSWKSKMIDKSKGTKRMNNKYEMALDIAEKFPVLIPYFRKCPSKDYDSFDACGIVHGYLKSYFKDGKATIAGNKDYYGDVVVYYKLLDPVGLSGKDLIAGFELQHTRKGVKVLQYDKANSPLDNFLRAAARYPFVMTEIKDPMANLAIRWQFGLGIDGGVLIAYIIRKAELTSVVQTRYLDSVYAKEVIYQ